MKRATSIAAYASMEAEVDTWPILDRLWREGREVSLPRVGAPLTDLTLHRVAGRDELERAPMGILEPGASAPLAAREAVDVVLIPALAVDSRGHRLGWGKGYYDRFLPSLTRATRIALAFDFQLLGELPNTESDVPVQLIVTDSAVHHVGVDDTG
jgi:5-formyltetrahydrofolate cyclo-ligase